MWTSSSCPGPMHRAFPEALKALEGLDGNTARTWCTCCGPHLDNPVVCDQQVRRLEISVDDCRGIGVKAMHAHGSSQCHAKPAARKWIATFLSEVCGDTLDLTAMERIRRSGVGRQGSVSIHLWKVLIGALGHPFSYNGFRASHVPPAIQWPMPLPGNMPGSCVNIMNAAAQRGKCSAHAGCSKPHAI